MREIVDALPILPRNFCDERFERLVDLVDAVLVDELLQGAFNFGVHESPPLKSKLDCRSCLTLRAMASYGSGIDARCQRAALIPRRNQSRQTYKKPEYQKPTPGRAGGSKFHGNFVFGSYV